MQENIPKAIAVLSVSVLTLILLITISNVTGMAWIFLPEYENTCYFVDGTGLIHGVIGGWTSHVTAEDVLYDTEEECYEGRGEETYYSFHFEDTDPWYDDVVLEDDDVIWIGPPDLDIGISYLIEGVCNDGVDNDNDTYIDCQDYNCNDGEYYDSGYSIDPWSSEPRCSIFEFLCNDGFDNDGNGLVDCEDPFCDASKSLEVYTNWLPEDWVEQTELNVLYTESMEDNSLQFSYYEPTDSPDRTYVEGFSGILDYYLSLSVCEYNTELTCSDSVDNDADGLIDCSDPDCDLRLCDEYSGYICDDGSCVEYIPFDVVYGSQQIWELYSSGNYYSGLLSYLHDYIYHADDCGGDIEIYPGLIDSHKICVPEFLG